MLPPPAKGGNPHLASPNESRSYCVSTVLYRHSRHNNIQGIREGLRQRRHNLLLTCHCNHKPAYNCKVFHFKLHDITAASRHPCISPPAHTVSFPRFQTHASNGQQHPTPCIPTSRFPRYVTLNGFTGDECSIRTSPLMHHLELTQMLTEGWKLEAICKNPENAIKYLNPIFFFYGPISATKHSKQIVPEIPLYKSNR